MNEKAIKKMLKELDIKEYNSVMERIHVWLCNQTDEKLIEGVLKEDRTIHGASMYCYKKGSEIAVKNGSTGVADVTPEMEIEWVEEYYLAKNINQSEVMKWPTPSASSSNQKVVEKIVEKEVIKEVFVGTPSMEHIEEFLAQQRKEKLSARKARQDKEENLSLF